MDLYPFKSGLHMMEPVALPRYYVDIQVGQSEEHFRQVLWVEPIPPFQFVDMGAITAGNALQPQEGTNLELNDYQFAQYRWYPIDHIQVTQFLPGANAEHALKNLIVPVDENTLTRDPDLHFTEFFVWEQTVPYFTPLNYTSQDLAQSRLIAMGFRYIVTKADLPTDVINNIKAGVTPCTVIPCYGRPK